jgi:prepilin-type N-terminal cleavage/methylation domain-containing protein
MNKKGFTLIEVIIVLVIIGIITAIAIPQLAGWKEQQKELDAVKAALEEPAVKKAPPTPPTVKSTTTDDLTSTIYEIAVLKSAGGERPTLKEIWPDVASRTGVVLKGWLNGNSNVALANIGGTTYVVNYDQIVGMVVNIEEF